MRSTRRDFLKTSSLLALGSAAPAGLGHLLRPPPTSTGDPVLVVIQLNGGNDGINTVVPYRDPGYAKHREELRIPEDRLLKIDDRVALHRSLEPFMKLIEDDRLSIVQGVGYPDPDRSHFRSMAIWHHARRDPLEHTGAGWLGRALDRRMRDAGSGSTPRNSDPAAMFVGDGVAPVAVRGSRAAASSIDRIEDFLLAPGMDPRPLLAARKGDDVASFVQRSLVDACGTADRIATLAAAAGDRAAYPGYALARRLRLIAHLLKVDHGARVFYVRQSGYDTHTVQRDKHSTLLARLSRSISAFVQDLTAAQLDDRVTILVFSEFGRTVQENASNGTDHGTAGPVFVVGKNLRSPLVGTPPSLEDLTEGEPRVGMDFRRVYATLLRDVLRVDPARIVPGAAPFPLFRER